MPADKRKAKKISQPSTPASAQLPAKPKNISAQTSSPASSGNLWTAIAICVFIAVLTWIVFGQTLRHDFINFDDDAYVYENAVVQHGLTPAGVAWAFEHVVAWNWHPLTVLSHELDCQFFGLNPGGHHFTNVLLHTATAVMLFLVLRRMTRTLWPCAFVAAVFAVHPLRAESVAWVAERKDVLSGLFFMLTLWAYVRYAEESKNEKSKAKTFYTLVLVFYALGLLSKPMLVTVPFIMLLLDYWPLKRSAECGVRSAESKKDPGTIGWSRLLLEKAPLFLMSAVICVTTFLVQDSARRAAESISLPMRLGNAIVSSAVYVVQLFYPVNLAAFYPYPASGWPAWEVALSLLFLAGISAACFYWRQKRPYLLAGWLWYLVMLMPVIGLVQVGTQARADRYTYLPEIGLVLGLTWVLAELTAKWQNRSLVLGVGSAAILAILVVMAHAQTAVWRTSETLWTHALACTTNNAVAESNLANQYLRENRVDDAITHAQAAIAIKPDYADAQNCLGFALFQAARVDEAIPHYQAALKAQPDFAAAHNNYGLALMQSGRLEEAISEYQAAIKLPPPSAESHNNLGVALLRAGQPAVAVAEYQKAIELNPDFISADNNLAWLLATHPDAAVRNGSRAIPLAHHANQLANAGNLIILRTLAAAYAEAGKFPEAIQTAEQALQLATAQQKSAWINTLRSDLGLYQSSQPLRVSGTQ